MSHAASWAMLVASVVDEADSSVASADCSANSFTIWRFSSRHGSEVSTNVDYSDDSELQSHKGAYEPHKTTWTGMSSKEGQVLVVHFVHPSVYNPTKRDSSSACICVFSPGHHKVKGMWG